MAESIVPITKNVVNIRSSGSNVTSAAIAPTAAVRTTTAAAFTLPASQPPNAIVGIISDLTMLAASIVNNVASAVAVTVGPQAFWGVPYRIAVDVAGTAASVARLATGEPPWASGAGPFPVTYGVLDGLAFFDPTKPPAGANDPSISVTAAHPLPIILVNATSATQGTNWSVGAPVLANAGYKVFTFNYGNITADPNFPIQATDDITKSALQLSDEVDAVLAETGASKVILIGHSQGGGILPEYYLNNLGGASKVSQLIGIAPSNHGTDVNGLAAVKDIPIVGSLVYGLIGLFGAAWTQQAIGSPLADEVYGNGDTRPGVQYTTISTVNDWVVTPYTQQALNGPNVTNIVLQDQYPGFIGGHIAIAWAPQTWSAVLGALATNSEASPRPEPALVAA